MVRVLRLPPGSMNPERPLPPASTLNRLMPGKAEDSKAVIATGIAAFFLVLVGTLVEWRSLLNNDVGWLLHVAERVLVGETLYRDIIEINPPLIVWLNVPVIWVAQAVHLPKVIVVRAAVLLVMLGCAALAAMLAGHTRTLSPRWTFLLALLVLVTFPFSYFGEREHLILGFTLPWFVIAVCRMEGCVPPAWARVVSGVLLGIALSLKPHYALAWLLPLGYLAWVRRSTDVLRMPEQLTAFATITGYAALVVVVTPEYLDLIRRLGGAYLDWLPESLPTMLLGTPGGLTATGILIVYFLARSRGSATDVLALGSAGFLVGVLLQRRGNDYHYYPAVASGLVLLGFTLRGAPRARRLAGVAFGILAGSLFVIACIKALGPESQEVLDYREFRRAVGPMDSTTSVLSLAPRGGLPFQLVNHEEVQWALRYPFPIVPAMIYARQLDRPTAPVYHPPANRSPLEQWFVTTVLDDAERARPSILLIHIPSEALEGRDLRVDFAAYFSVEPRFRALLAQYRYAGQAAGFRIYRRIARRG